MPIQQQDTRPFESLTEEELNEILERTIAMSDNVDYTLKGNIEYQTNLLKEVLRRRKLQPETKAQE